MPDLLNYPSGSQARVFVDGIWIDDIHAISWDVRQEKRPLWGYASQYFDAVAKGILIINGTFVINFKGRGYINALIDFIKRQDPKKRSQLQGIIDGLRDKDYSEGDVANLVNDKDFDVLTTALQEVAWEPEDLIEQPINRPDEYDKGLNLVIKYGSWRDFDPPTTKKPESHFSTTTLRGVQIVGQSQIIRVGGENIKEQYNFLARSVDDAKDIGLRANF